MMKMLPVINIVMVLIVLGVPCFSADIYVDYAIGPGVHSGTMDDPYRLISDAMGIAQAGDRVHIAENIYNEIIVIPEGVSLYGGYSQNFSIRDASQYHTVINGNGADQVVTAQGQFHLDGLQITNGVTGIFGSDIGSSTIHDCHIHSITGGNAAAGPAPANGQNAYGIFLSGHHVTISYCLLDTINGGSGGGCTVPGNNSGSGGSAYGMLLHVANPKILACHLELVQGGHGGNGINNQCNGGTGGHAFGIVCTSGSAFGLLPDISYNFVTQLNAGNGGNGGVQWDYGGDSADGGNVVGILFDNYTKAGVISNNWITNLTSGQGGQTDWAHLVAGEAGDAGYAVGISVDESTDTLIRDNLIENIMGARGGIGGSAGDYPGSGESTQGGDGGDAWGIYDQSSESNNYINNLVVAIQGGDGQRGGAYMQTTTCSSGGLGGMAVGIDLVDGEHFVQLNTVHQIFGGHGGDGGKSYWTGFPKTTNPILTPTPTPTSQPGYICCGSGGDGGYAVGIRFPHCDFMERYTYNIVNNVHGGTAGDCFEPDDGEGVGMEKLDLCSVIIDYNNVYDYTTIAYRNMGPGPNIIIGDPLFIQGDKGNYYLSQLTAGQASDSPCINAADIDASSVFAPESYTTRTDHIEDMDLLDIGFHYPIGGTPTPYPTVTPSVTPTGPTPTPTSEATITPTPTVPSEYMVWVDLELPQTDFRPGDTFFCHLDLDNVSDIQFVGFPQFVILDVEGVLLFAPKFNDFDYYSDDIMPGKSHIVVIPEFAWPENSGTMANIWLHAAVTNPEISGLISNLESVSFSWSE